MADITQQDVQNLINEISNLVGALGNNNVNNEEVRNYNKAKDLQNILHTLEKQGKKRSSDYKDVLNELKQVKDELKDEKLKIKLDAEERDYRKNLITERINKIGSSLVGAVSNIHNITLVMRRENLRETKNAYERGQKLFRADLEMRQAATQSMMSTFSSFMQETATVAARNISQAARSEANAYIDYVTKQKSAELEYEIASRETELESRKGIKDGVVGTLSGVLGAFGGVVETVGGIILNAANGVAEMQIKKEELNIEQLKQQNEIYQGLMDNVKSVSDRFKGIADDLANIANSVVDKMRDLDTTYKRGGLGFGFSGDEYSSYMRNLAPRLAENFNLSAQQLMDMQNSYIVNSGRAKMLNVNEYEKTEAMSRLYGMSQGEVSTLMGEMNLFNLSIDTGYNIMEDMYKIITKMGLSTSKFSKELMQNLKIAQKYNFKGGVENMAKLTKWAEQTRFNLQSTTSFVDKMMSNNISDVLETSARLQVLGGAAAMFSDPFAMMYEAGNDFAAFAQRNAAMFSDIGGTFNEQTGDVRFNNLESRRIRALSEITGQSVEDIRNQRRQSIIQDRVDYALRDLGFSEEDRLAIGNRAKYKNGKFYVQTTTGEKDITSLRPGGLGDLLPDNESDSLVDIAKNTRSMVEIEEAQLSQLQLQTGVQLWQTMGENSIKLLEAQKSLYNNKGVYSGLDDNLKHQTDVSVLNTERLIKTFNDTNNAQGLKDYYSYVKNGVSELTMLSEAELGLMAILAKKNGVGNVSQLMHDIATLSVSEEDDEDKRRNELLNRYKEDKDMYEVLKMFSDGSYRPTHDDGVGLLNGGLITNASHVKSINDGVVKTHVADEYLAAKPNGPIDKLFNGVIAMIQEMYDNQNGKNIGSSPLNISLNGRLDLSQNNSNINLVEIIKRDPVQSRDLIRILLKALDSTQNGKITEYHNI